MTTGTWYLEFEQCEYISDEEKDEHGIFDESDFAEPLDVFTASDRLNAKTEEEAIIEATEKWATVESNCSPKDKVHHRSAWKVVEYPHTPRLVYVRKLV